MDETSSKKERIQKKLRQQLIALLALVALSAGAALGWFFTKSPFWVGLLIGLCPGLLVGVPTGFLLMVWFAVSDPEKFSEIIKG